MGLRAVVTCLERFESVVQRVNALYCSPLGRFPRMYLHLRVIAHLQGRGYVYPHG